MVDAAADRIWSQDFTVDFRQTRQDDGGNIYRLE